jgi:hypothetical protein
MSELAARMPLSLRPSLLGPFSRWGAAALSLVLLGAGFADILYGANISLALALAGGLALVVFLALTVRSYDAAVAVGLLLMGVVRFEPSPPSRGAFA